jgi:hypothetical protein
VANTITKVQVDEVARILGFPNLSPMSSLSVDYPYFSSQLALWQPYAIMNIRLSQASPSDEVQYFGAESPQFAFFYTPSTVAITFSTPTTVAPNIVVNLNAGGTVLTYTTGDTDTPNTVCAQFAQQINQNPNVNPTFMANPVGPVLNIYYITAIGTDGNGIQCMVTSSDPSLLSTFYALIPPAQFSFGATSLGTTPPGPQFTPIGTDETVFGYVPIIHILESDLINSRINLDTLKADVWQPRQDELKVRYALLWQYRKELADRISVPLDPDIASNASGMTQRIV